MARNNKKKRGKTDSSQNSDYDLRKSLGKLNQRKKLPKSETSTNFEIKKSSAENINSTSINENLTDETNIYFKLNESINSRYDVLSENIQSISDKVNDSSDNLRIEVDEKLDKKLDSNIFFYAVSALILITILIFTLSYSNLISDTNDNTDKVQDLNNKIENQKEDIEKIEEKIESIEKKQDDLEIEMIRKDK
jgi:hypothetical protein